MCSVCAAAAEYQKSPQLSNGGVPKVPLLRSETMINKMKLFFYEEFPQWEALVLFRSSCIERVFGIVVECRKYPSFLVGCKVSAKAFLIFPVSKLALLRSESLLNTI